MRSTSSSPPGVVSVFGDVFTLVAIMAAMLLLDWRLALVAFAVIPLIALVTQWFRVHVRETYREVRVLIARINAFLQEHITGMATVQLFRREARAFDEFDDINRAHMNANVRSIFYYAVFYPAIEIVGALATALMLWFGGGRVVQDTLTLGTLVALIQYAQRFFRPIQDLSEKFNVLQGAMASSERIFQLLDTPVAIDDPPDPARSARAPRACRSAGAGCAGTASASRSSTSGSPINGDDYVLRDVSFVVEPGPAHRHRRGDRRRQDDDHQPDPALLRRQPRPDYRRSASTSASWPLADLRRVFGLVLQDVHLFSGTVAANIRLGNDAPHR